jgi:integrase/recombinase XerD
MTRALVPFSQPLAPAVPQLQLSRPIRRRHFANEILIEKFDKYLTAINFSKNTRLRYGAWAKQFGAFLGEKNFAAIKPQDVRDFIGTLHERDCEASTMANALFALRALYKFLELGDQVFTSAPRHIQTRKIPKRLPVALSEEEIERMLAVAQTPRDLAILELLYATGLRVSELVHLRCEDVDMQGRSLVVRGGKGNKDRIGLFGRAAAAALRLYLGDRTHGFLFRPEQRPQRGGVWMDRHYHIWFGQWRETNADGKRVVRTVRLGDHDLPTKERARQALDAILAVKLPPGRKASPMSCLTAHSVWRMIVKAAKRAGIQKTVGPHTFRHSCATACLNHGMDIRFVQELLGHDSLASTQKYLHVATGTLQLTHAKFHPRG